LASAALWHTCLALEENAMTDVDSRREFLKKATAGVSVGLAARGLAAGQKHGAIVFGNCCTHGAGVAGAFRGHPRVELVGGFETDPRRGPELARAMGKPLAKSLDELLARADVSIVGVACDPCDKAGAVEKAAAAGKHIFLNKPMCESLDSARRIVQAVGKAGVKCVLDIPMVKFTPPFAKLLADFKAGRFGKVFGYYHNFGMNFALDFDLGAIWPERLDPPAKSGGGEMTNMGCYAIDYMVTLLGKPRSVEAKWRHEWPCYREAKAEHFGQIVCDYGDFYAVLAVGKQQLAGESRHSSCFHLITEHENLLVDGYAKVVTRNNVPVRFEDYIAGVRVESPLDQFLRCIETGAEPASSVSLGADGVEVLMAAYASIVEGRAVALPLKSGKNPLTR
jgi:predicted dehydrogenase